MLLNNEWKAAGLVNGATGTILKIIYAPGSKPPDLPRYCYIADLIAISKIGDFVLPILGSYWCRYPNIWGLATMGRM